MASKTRGGDVLGKAIYGLVNLTAETREDLQCCYIYWANFKEHTKLMLTSLQAILLVLNLHPVQLQVRIARAVHRLDEELGLDTLHVFSHKLFELVHRFVY